MKHDNTQGKELQTVCPHRKGKGGKDIVEGDESCRRCFWYDDAKMLIDWRAYCANPN